jgi:tetratricopeptide (TPR) repeat protein
MASAIEIFFCYAREDEELLKGLEKQLHALKLQGIIDVWHDRQISAGSDWEREIDKHLNSAHIILLLVSPDFMVSSYCYSKEMVRAMDRHERGEACVIPVILRPVYWQGAPFGKLQALPTDAKAVASRHWYNLDEAFYDVAQGIYAAVQKLTPKLAAKAAVEELPEIRPLPPFASLPPQRTPAVKAQKTKEQWMEEGNRFRDLKQYSEALAAYDEALRLDPKDAFAYSNKGYVLDELKQYEEGLAACEQAIRLNPKDAAAYTNKGWALDEFRRYEEALAAYEQAIRLDPNNALAYNNKGHALRALNREKEAQQAFAKAREFGYEG